MDIFLTGLLATPLYPTPPTQNGPMLATISILSLNPLRTPAQGDVQI
jgi:hypothetical protein